jgi:hypothetical protein
MCLSLTGGAAGQPHPNFRAKSSASPTLPNASVRAN